MSHTILITPNSDEVCCSACPEDSAPCTGCISCEDLPETIIAVLSGFAPMSGCFQAGGGQYIEITGGVIDGTYALNGGGGTWSYGGTGDYLDANLYGADSTCTAADPGMDTANSLTISLSCVGGVLSVGMAVLGDYLAQYNDGTAGPPPGNPVTIGTITDESHQSLVAAGSITLSWT